MNDLIQKLGTLLAAQLKLYNELFHTLEKEYEYLVASKSEELNQVILNKENLLLRLQELEEQRFQTCVDIAAKNNLKILEPKLSDIANLVDAKTGQDLLRIKNQFELIFQLIRDKNTVNEMMAKSALDTVETTIQVVKDSLQPAKTYEKKGQVNKTAQHEHLFQRKA